LPAVGREDQNAQYQFGINYILVFFAYWQSSG
jgi:hypothetical protein